MYSFTLPSCTHIQSSSAGWQVIHGFFMRHTHRGFPLFETDLLNSGKTWTPSSKLLLLGLEQVLQTRLDIQTSSWVVFSMVVFTRIFPARTFFIPNTQSGICFDSFHKDTAHLLPVSVAHENSWGAVGVKDLERRTRWVWCVLSMYF